MQITVATLDEKLFAAEVSEGMEVAHFKSLCETLTAIPTREMVVVWQGRPLLDAGMTLGQYGVGSGDLVLVQRLSGHTPSHASLHDLIDVTGMSSAHPNEADMVREILMKSPTELEKLKQTNPALAKVLLSGDKEKFRKMFNELRDASMQQFEQQLRLAYADPFHPDAQKMIEDAISLRNIESNMASALEFAPESFGQVHMLFIDCRVNGFPVKAFVDTGAQTTIMSQECAKKCNLVRLIDKRWQGLAIGVGEKQIIGRIHLCQIQIGNVFLQSSFAVLDNKEFEMMLGLDMLKRHQCLIDLQNNQLVIGTTGTSTPFLAEADLPEYARLHRLNQSTFRSEQDLTKALQLSAQEPRKASTSVARLQSEYPDEDIVRLMSYGFSRDAAVQELQACRGDVSRALASLLSQVFRS